MDREQIDQLIKRELGGLSTLSAEEFAIITNARLEAAEEMMKAVNFRQARISCLNSARKASDERAAHIYARAEANKVYEEQYRSRANAIILEAIQKVKELREKQN